MPEAVVTARQRYIKPMKGNVMLNTAEGMSWLTEPFDPISLKALEANSGMLERIDNKYVVNKDILKLAAPELAQHFDMLDIDGRRNFTYDTCYFDDPDCRSYLDHHQARKKRVKVRMRKYLEAGLCFVEVKLKDKRGMTVKKRLRCCIDKYGTLDQTAERFVQEVYSSLYGRAFKHRISRNLDMRYRRMTLVAKVGGERMTLDNDVHFFLDGKERRLDPSLFIIEAKSAKGNGIADRILRRLHQHPTKHVSKYCTGLAALREGTKYNNFRRALDRLGLLEKPQNEAMPGAKQPDFAGTPKVWSIDGKLSALNAMRAVISGRTKRLAMPAGGDAGAPRTSLETALPR